MERSPHRLPIIPGVLDRAEAHTLLVPLATGNDHVAHASLPAGKPNRLSPIGHAPQVHTLVFALRRGRGDALGNDLVQALGTGVLGGNDY